ncbi:hypothetical protein [Sphingobacterium paucimobilis]|uniref:Uncharacterized protein n=1 Tax=Sphingobacterium paucimobilis HER1398 TaxID=1346330 RepID=U2HWE3_9SPHI|nr:hypothetical protein [Sphingobacterium paucimobilis]ERJ59852.1 hypothetical protein M472_13860 [Sphingobacterium paucimobilis HER1398]
MKIETQKRDEQETAQRKSKNQGSIGQILQTYRKANANSTHTPVAQRNPRIKLGQDLYSNLISKNFHSKGIFKGMNHMMYRNNIPMSPEHELVLRQKLITENAGLWDTLKAENSHVLASQGHGLLYNMGKQFHTYFVHPFTK